MAINIKVVFRRMASILSRRSRRLMSLPNVIANDSVEKAYPLGLQSVSLSQIRGSASPGRCKDFDVNFRPVNSHSEERWVGIHRARTSGRRLPPVTLIQVGENYFVEDGHHRVSVAYALGDETIEGRVTLWELSES